MSQVLLDFLHYSQWLPYQCTIHHKGIQEEARHRGSESSMSGYHQHMIGGQTTKMSFYELPQTIMIPQTNGKQHSTMIKNPIPTWTGVRMTAPQTIDPDMIADAIHKHFGVQLKPFDRPEYKKPYPQWIDKIARFPRGQKILDFSTFSREDGKVSFFRCYVF